MNHKIAFTFPPFKPEGYDELKEKGYEVFMPEPGFPTARTTSRACLRTLR